jgi:small-conductance mechanosensitive channel
MGIPKTVFTTFLLSTLPVLIFVLVLFLANFFLTRKFGETTESVARKQLTMLILILLGVIFLVATLPLTEPLKGRILGLFGILSGSALALSLVRFCGNFLTGIWLKSTGSFHLGDFIRIREHSGRVRGRGLFHTEIESGDRSLIILPNLFLASHPVQVQSASHPVLSAEIPFRSNVPRDRVEAVLVRAAQDLQLEDIVVEVVALDDSSATYRIKGLVPGGAEPASLRLRLNALILDGLQGAGIVPAVPEQGTGL